MTGVHELDTPCVTIDLDRVEANIARVQAAVAGAGLANRPHVKTHKIPAIAHLADYGMMTEHLSLIHI